jgi:hypothetical protein
MATPLKVKQLLTPVFLTLGCTYSMAGYGQTVDSVQVKKDTLAMKAQQRDLIDIGKDILHVKGKHPVKIKGTGVYFSFGASSTSVAGSGNLLITATTAAFYLGNPATTYLSSLTISPVLVVHNHWGIILKSNLWFKNRSWVEQGDTRFLYYPQYTWGLGGNPDNNNRIIVDYKYVRAYHAFLKRIKPYLYAGLGYQYDGHYDIDTQGDSAYLANFTRYEFGTSNTEKSVSSGLTLNLLYDSRKNQFNPLPGFYGNLVYRFNPVFLGSSTYWSSLYLDFRKYIPFSFKQQNLLAFWAFYWTTLGTHTPYLDLPAIGWDPYQQRSGRGFEQNRYRGTSMFYLESEYRRDITHDGLLGFVLFTNCNTVAEPDTRKFTYLHPAIGGGLRIKFNKHSNTNIALDFGQSRGYSAFYLNVGETF